MQLIFAQAEYIPYDHPVYDFLNRMDSRHIISNYNSFELPKTRGQIAGYLKEVILSTDLLDNVDRAFLEDFKTEFEFDLFGTVVNSQRLIGSGDYDFFSDNEKYLFFHSEAGKASLFINLIAEGELLSRNQLKPAVNSTSHFGIIGGEIRGTFLNKFGFSIKGTNGNVFGDKKTALLKRELQYNYKLNENPDETFFDETEGYITADFDIVRFKLGRNRIVTGYGSIKSIFSDNSPVFDNISFDINYRFIQFSYFHGKLLGDIYYAPDSITGGSNVLTEKYIGYHRLGFNISRHFSFGVGEMIIYGDRPIDLSYLNPFNFYKSVEHSNRDRDNALLFFDVKNNSIKGLQLFGNLIIDDVSFSKLGTGWWGNQFLVNVGLFSSNLYHTLPLDLRMEYLRIEPYTFTHRLSRNSYTNFGYSLGPDLQPNSELFLFKINYRFSSELVLSTSFAYSVHGANPVNTDGSVRNVGGDINLGHRLSDSDTAVFLDGDRQYSRKYSVDLYYEPINLIKVTLSSVLTFSSLQNSLIEKQLFTFLNLSIRF